MTPAVSRARLRAAHHEAGHIAAASFLRRHFAPVRLLPQPRHRTHAHSTVLLSMPLPDLTYDGDPEEVQWRNALHRNATQDLMMVLCAGEAAERHHAGRGADGPAREYDAACARRLAVAVFGVAGGQADHTARVWADYWTGEAVTSKWIALIATELAARRTVHFERSLALREEAVRLVASEGVHDAS